MVKPALAAARAVRVLDYLALHPGQAFTLKEISRACGVNAASLLSVLTALAEGGYVVRHPGHKTYTIGPGVVALGNAALIQHPTVEAARNELELLAAELDGQCSAAVAMGTELVAVATAGRHRRPDTGTQVGMRLPLVAPFGAPFAAFGTHELRRAWMRQASGSSEDAPAGPLDRALDDLGARGFCALGERPARRELVHVLQALANEPANDRVRARLDVLLEAMTDAFVDLDRLAGDGGRLPVANVTAPVFTPVGRVVMVLTASGFAGPLGAPAITEIGQRLRASAEAVAGAAFGSAGPSRPGPARRRS